MRDSGVSPGAHCFVPETLEQITDRTAFYIQFASATLISELMSPSGYRAVIASRLTNRRPARPGNILHFNNMHFSAGPIIEEIYSLASLRSRDTYRTGDLIVPGIFSGAGLNPWTRILVGMRVETTNTECIPYTRNIGIVKTYSNLCAPE